MANDQITDMYVLTDALGAAIRAAPKAERDALAATLDAYQKDFPEDYNWALRAQSPTLLSLLMTSIGFASHDDDPSRTSRMVNFISRKPEGNA